MFASLAQSFDELSAADARRAALGYVSEAFAEAMLDGIEVEILAEAAVCAAFRELVVAYGEEKVAPSRRASARAGPPGRIFSLGP